MKIRFDTPPVSAQQSNGLAVRYAAAKREVPRWRWYLMLAVIGLPLAYFLWQFVVDAWWGTAPGFVLVPTLAVKAVASGTVRGIVPVGTQVAASTPLLRIEPVTVAPPAAALSASNVTPRVEPVATGANDAALGLLARGVELAERTVSFRRGRQATIEALKRDSAATQAEADGARASVVQAESDVLRARTDLELRRRTLADESRRALAASLSAPAVVAAAVGPGPIVVTSPFAGIVTATLAVDGEYVATSTDVLMLQAHGAPMIAAYVSPSDAKYAQVGRRATLRFFDGLRVSAVVTEVAGQTARIPVDRVGPLSPRTQAILVHMKPETELSARYRIDLLPLDVRFETLWPWQP